MPSPARRTARKHRIVNEDVPALIRTPPVPCRSIAVAWLALMPFTAALGADGRPSHLPDASAPFGPVGWGLVVALGLLAVVAGAFTMSRPKRFAPPGRAANDSRLGPTIAGPMPGEGCAIPEARADDAADQLTPTQPPKRSTTPAVPAGTAAEASRAGVTAAPPTAADASRASPSADAPTAATAPTREAASDATGDASAFLALHHVDLSIDVLREHIERESRPMPAVWVMLLDLCRTHGREQKFRELAVEFHQRFNVRAPSWDRYPPGRGEPGLEAYPRLVKTITATWGTYECRRLLDRLLYDNRGGTRRGFSLNAYNDLIALRRAAQSVLETIEADLALEAKQAAVAPGTLVATPGEVSANDEVAGPSPLIRDLEDQLEGDLAPVAAESALEREHPAFAGVLVREWGNAALAGRLCEMLARGGDGARPLSAEVAEELELLRRVAERLGTSPPAVAAAGD
jgi:hypothetical protein